MKLKYEFAIQEVIGNYVAVAVGNKADQFGGVIRLNDTGKRIFELIQQELDEDAIVAALAQEYDASDDALRAEARKVVAELRSQDVLA